MDFKREMGNECKKYSQNKKVATVITHGKMGNECKKSNKQIAAVKIQTWVTKNTWNF